MIFIERVEYDGGSSRVLKCGTWVEMGASDKHIKLQYCSNYWWCEKNVTHHNWVHCDTMNNYTQHNDFYC